MTSYAVDVSRDGRFWLIHVPGVERYTQGRKLSEVREMAQDLVEIMTGEPADQIQLDVRITLPNDITERLDRAAELREQAAQAQGAAARELREAAHELRERGLTLREIGEVLGLSYQRAHQLVSDKQAA